MIRPPLPFLAKKKVNLPKTISEQRNQGRKLMTLVATLAGHQGTIMFADNQEVVSGYAKRNVDKLCVYELPGKPIRFAIGGSTSDGNYTDMLQGEIAAALNHIEQYDLKEIMGTLTDAVTTFYGKHNWPRSTDKPQMEWLITVQPLPFGRPEIFHIVDTAVNILGITTHEKSIGVGSYLMDYLTGKLLGGGESLIHLVAAAVYMAREIRDSVDGVGSVERIVIFDVDGGYDELEMEDIATIENIVRFTSEVTETVFRAIAGGTEELNLDDYQDA